MNFFNVLSDHSVIFLQPERRPVPDPELCLLLSATDMLASCAEGRNLFIESVCQNIFSFEELIELEQP